MSCTELFVRSNNRPLFVTVEQVAALAAFLCSEDAASITGAVLPIEGGWTAQYHLSRLRIPRSLIMKDIPIRTLVLQEARQVM